MQMVLKMNGLEDRMLRKGGGFEACRCLQASMSLAMLQLHPIDNSEAGGMFYLENKNMAIE